MASATVKPEPAYIRSLADVQALEQTPFSRRALPESTYALLRQGAAINPDNYALRFFLRGGHYQRSHEVTFRELMEQIHRAANLFHSLGVGKSDVISTLLPNVPEHYYALFGGEAAGIVNPVNPLLEPGVIAEIMNAAQTKVLVTLGPLPKTDIWQKAVRIAQKVPTLETLLTVDLSPYLPWPLRWPARLASLRIAAKTARPTQRVADFRRLAAQQPPESLSFERRVARDDIASYFHTGGTTGTPKLARRTHYNEVVNAWSSMMLIRDAHLKSLFCGLPLFHNGGFNAGSLYPLSRGATLVVGTPAGYRGEGLMDNFWKIVEHFRLNMFIGVPAVFSKLLELPVDADIESLECALCGAALMPVEMIRRFEKHTGVTLVEGYGLTEATSLCTANPPYGDYRSGSIGFRLPYQELKIVALDDAGRFRRECATDESGVIAVRGPNIFAGYTEATLNRHIWLDLGDGGEKWLNTGDLGRLDKAERLWITGRVKELIIRGGHNIDPKLIEAPLYEHPAVALAAAVGRPDARVGELPVAYVQLKPGMAPAESELLDFLKQRIGERAALPRRIHIVDVLPLTAVNKIFKPALIRLEIADAYREALADIPDMDEPDITVTENARDGNTVEIRLGAHSIADMPRLSADIAERLAPFAYPYRLLE